MIVQQCTSWMGLCPLDVGAVIAWRCTEGCHFHLFCQAVVPFPVPLPLSNRQDQAFAKCPTLRCCHNGLPLTRCKPEKTALTDAWVMKLERGVALSDWSTEIHGSHMQMTSWAKTHGTSSMMSRAARAVMRQSVLPVESGPPRGSHA